MPGERRGLALPYKRRLLVLTVDANHLVTDDLVAEASGERDDGALG